jgi:hypothetical protein
MKAHVNLNTHPIPYAEEKTQPSPSLSSLYEAPVILWEEEFVALAQSSLPACIPGMDPRCTP